MVEERNVGRDDDAPIPSNGFEGVSSETEISSGPFSSVRTTLRPLETLTFGCSTGLGIFFFPRVDLRRGIATMVPGLRILGLGLGVAPSS